MFFSELLRDGEVLEARASDEALQEAAPPFRQSPIVVGGHLLAVGQVRRRHPQHQGRDPHQAGNV